MLAYFWEENVYITRCLCIWGRITGGCVGQHDLLCAPHRTAPVPELSGGSACGFSESAVMTEQDFVHQLQAAGIKVVDQPVRYADGDTILHADLFRVCRSLAEGWSAAPDGDLVVSTIKGGITNLLFRVIWSTAPDGVPSALLVRVFGAKTDIMIDRLKDNRVFAELGALGFGPVFHGAFRNGRIEGWREMRPLAPEEMGAPRFLPGIANT